MLWPIHLNVFFGFPLEIATNCLRSLRYAALILGARSFKTVCIISLDIKMNFSSPIYFSVFLITFKRATNYF